MYQAKSGVKNFSLYWGGGSLFENFFFQSEHVSSQIWCQKFFPLLGGGVPRDGVPPWRWGPPHPRLGYPPSKFGVPPHPWLDRVPPPPPSMAGSGTPRRGVDWQTENSTFPHPSDAGGNKLLCNYNLHTNTIKVSSFILPWNLCGQLTFKYIAIGQLITIMLYNWPQFNKVKEDKNKNCVKHNSWLRHNVHPKWHHDIQKMSFSPN